MCHYEFAIDMLDVDERDLDDELDFFDSENEEDYKRGIRDKDDDWVEEEMERLLWKPFKNIWNKTFEIYQ